MSGRAWKLYSPGEFVFDANVTVLEVLEIDLLQSNTIYAIRYECCSTKSTLTHAGIRDRICKASSKCRHCHRRQRAKPGTHRYVPDTIDVALPIWPVPPSIAAMSGHWIWEDCS